ncbi:DUF1295 domain-containing protein [Rhodobacterales bacterium HKCCE2091]|nr:DUF1295 domain-containing protein [Rhodobacterales bacterium HKCCE2091]
MTGGLVIGLTATAAWVAILMISRNGTGPWPPERGGWFTAVYAWGLTILIYVGLFQAWAEDANAFGWPGWIRWGVGGALMAASFGLQGWGTVDLGLRGTSGWPVPLRQTGSYALVRHPQYLGQMIGFAGMALAAANAAATVIALAAVALLILGSMVEDRFLSRHHDAFAAYARHTPFLIPDLYR